MDMKEMSSDAIELICRRYIKGDPARVASFHEELTKAAIAREICDLRNAAGLTHEQLATLIDTTPSVIEDIEEADYDGDFLAMASRIDAALHRRVEVRFVPMETTESAGMNA